MFTKIYVRKDLFCGGGRVEIGLRITRTLLFEDI
jgi:hypothetical protein